MTDRRRRVLDLLDLDATLLHTRLLERDMLYVLNKVYGIDPEQFVHEIRQRSDDNGYCYFEHLRDLYDISPDGAEETLFEHLSPQGKYFDPEQTAGAYEYSQTSEFIKVLRSSPDRDQLIVTVGRTRTQRFKLRLCPSLVGIPVIVIGYNKGKWIAVRVVVAYGQHLELRHDETTPTPYDGTLYHWVYLYEDRSTTFIHLEHAPTNVGLFHILRDDPDNKHTTPSTLKRVVQVGDLLEAFARQPA